MNPNLRDVVNIKNVPAKCKICGRPLMLQTEASYTALGDAFKLVPLATCDRCYDLRETRLRQENAIMKGCRMLVEGKNISDDRREKINQGIRVLCKSLASTLTMTAGNGMSFWDESFPQQLLENPGDAWTILRTFKKTVLEAVRIADRPAPTST